MAIFKIFIAWTTGLKLKSRWRLLGFCLEFKVGRKLAKKQSQQNRLKKPGLTGLVD